LKSQKQFLRTLLSFLIAGLFVFLAFRGISFESLLRDTFRANFLTLLVATIVALFSLFLRSLRWRVILQEIKPGISIIDTFGSLMVGYMLNNFVPRLGEVVRAYTTGKIENAKVSAVLGTIVLERLFDMLSAGILAGIVLATYGGNIIETFSYLRYAGIMLVVISAAAGVVFYIAATIKAANNLLMRLIKLVVPERFSRKVESMTNAFLSSFSMLRSPKRMLFIVFYTVSIWAVYFFQVYIPFFAFGSTSNLTFYSAFILGMVATVSWLIPSPGALGVYHLFVSQALTKLFGVPQDEALAYATLTHFFGYISITIAGAIFAFIFTHRLKIQSVRGFLEAEKEQ